MKYDENDVDANLKNELVSSLGSEDKAIKYIKDSSFDTGSLVIVKIIGEKGRADLKVGDVIVFKVAVDAFDFSQNGNGDEYKSGNAVSDFEMIVTHRIVEVVDSGYITKGDNNIKRDQDTTGHDFILSNQPIIGKVTSHAEGLGNVINWFQQDIGFFIIIVLPTLIFLIVELVSFIRSFIDYKNEGKVIVTEEDKEAMKKEIMEQISAEEKEKIRQELLEELRNKEKKE
jgi:signal peptidase